ncbi:hypothetical protein K7432_002696 [Basidiobolus ranarum]|uniref:Uncharacterized protein n=1 Tax=Basidiobolus ranarum TaxID=34480 RepID=A0ABR2W7D3_9FUNG
MKDDTKDTKNGRQDVLALKQKLADTLGENGPLYWNALKDFVTGKLNRQEFDFYANLYIPREHVKLHNAFILANISNAQKAAPPPPSQRSTKWLKRKKDRTSLEKDPKKKKLRQDILSLKKADRDRIKVLLKTRSTPAKPLPLRSTSRSIPFPPGSIPPNYISEVNKGYQAPLCYDSKELPDGEILHERMTTIALEHGLLNGVTPDSIEVLQYALESHLKTIISNCIYKVRCNRSMGIITSDAPSNLRERSDIFFKKNLAKSVYEMQPTKLSAPPPKTLLRLRDLAFSFEIAPFTMIEMPLVAERLTSILYEDTDDEGGEEEEEEDEEMEHDTRVIKI